MGQRKLAIGTLGSARYLEQPPPLLRRELSVLKEGLKETFRKVPEKLGISPVSLDQKEGF